MEFLFEGLKLKLEFNKKLIDDYAQFMKARKR